MTDDYMREKCFNYRPLNMATLPVFKMKAPPNYLTTRSNGFVTAPMPSVPPRNIDDLSKRLAQARRMNEIQGIQSSFQNMIKKKVEEETKKNVNTDSIFQKRRESNNNFSKEFETAEEGEERINLDDDISKDVEIEIVMDEDFGRAAEEGDMGSLKTSSTTSSDFIEDMDFSKPLNKMFNPRKERTDKGMPHEYPTERKSRMRGGNGEEGKTDEL